MARLNTYARSADFWLLATAGIAAGACFWPGNYGWMFWFAFVTGPAGKLLGLVEKRRLFPFGEYLPLAEDFPVLRKVFPYADNISAGAAGFLLRAVNTGMSAVIDPAGRILSRLGPEGQGFLTSDVRLLDCESFYTRHGGLSQYSGILFLSVLLLLSAACPAPWREP